MSSESLSKKIKIHCLKMANVGGGSHIGSALSISDILAVLYFDVLKINPKSPKWDQRDRFILSKGHAGAAIYACLAELGYFPLKKLKTHYKNGSDLSGHVSHINVPGVEISTGSLGHGLSIGVGMATASKIDKKKHKVFVLLSDGECDEGSIWEAAMFASHRKLNNLVAMIDYNKLQSLETTTETLDLEPFVDKWVSFGWDVYESDGHSHDSIKASFQKKNINNKPKLIIFHTVKGKGVSFMENAVLWHYRSPQGEEYERALKELQSL